MGEIDSLWSTVSVAIVFHDELDWRSREGGCWGSNDVIENGLKGNGLLPHLSQIE